MVKKRPQRRKARLEGRGERGGLGVCYLVEAENGRKRPERSNQVGDNNSDGSFSEHPAAEYRESTRIYGVKKGRPSHEEERKEGRLSATSRRAGSRKGRWHPRRRLKEPAVHRRGPRLIYPTLSTAQRRSRRKGGGGRCKEAIKDQLRRGRGTTGSSARVILVCHKKGEKKKGGAKLPSFRKREKNHRRGGIDRREGIRTVFRSWRAERKPDRSLLPSPGGDN